MIRDALFIPVCLLGLAFLLSPVWVRLISTRDRAVITHETHR